MRNKPKGKKWPKKLSHLSKILEDKTLSGRLAMTEVGPQRKEANKSMVS